MRLIYGFDPLCGWCYGAVPAIRAVQTALPDLPVVLALPGLVTGDRVGPYARMEGYIRGASAHLRAVTGRAPSPAFFDMITRPGLIGQSGPPALVIDAARKADPVRALGFAQRLIEAHFQDGADLNDPAIYPPHLKATGLDIDLPALTDQAARALWAAEAHWGIQSFPSLIVQSDSGDLRLLPSIYDPAALVACVRGAIAQ
jgi:putative protein-disulfide isomerase